MQNQAIVYLVGAGPGDPDLLTVKALRLIEQAAVLVYDRLVSAEILQLVPRGIKKIYVGKSVDHHAMTQDQINQLLVRLGSSDKYAGQKIVRLKGGDPFIFGRGSEEALELSKHNISYQIVPGITAAQGCSSYAGFPLTHRGMARKFQIITGHYKENQGWKIDADSLLDDQQTLVFYMGLGQASEIQKQLLEAGKPANTLVAIVQNGTTPRQYTTKTTLSGLTQTIEMHQIKAPALIFMGPTIALGEELEWLNDQCDSDIVSRYA
ncbi:MAG: uroporphyrinogen-III C-methyltransferase [bacterium]